MNNAIVLQPVIYSKSKTVKKIKKKITEYPEQRSNTPKALKGFVIDFNIVALPNMTISLKHSRPVGTLSEISNLFKYENIKILACDGIVNIKAIDGKFSIV